MCVLQQITWMCNDRDSVPVLTIGKRKQNEQIGHSCDFPEHTHFLWVPVTVCQFLLDSKSPRRVTVMHTHTGNNSDTLNSAINISIASRLGLSRTNQALSSVWPPASESSDGPAFLQPIGQLRKNRCIELTGVTRGHRCWLHSFRWAPAASGCVHLIWWASFCFPSPSFVSAAELQWRFSLKNRIWNMFIAK